MPGTEGNRNAIKHGKCGFLAIGSLPKGASYIRRLLGQFERNLRAAVVEAHGEISLARAALVQSAVRHEARSQLVTRWLRLRADSMSDGDKLAYVREIGVASDARDKCLKALELDRSTRANVIDALYATPTETEDATDGNHDPSSNS